MDVGPRSGDVGKNRGKGGRNHKKHIRHRELTILVPLAPLVVSSPHFPRFFRVVSFRSMKTTPPISRRSFLAMPLALAAQGQAKQVPVGLELYSVRAEYMRDLPGTVTSVAKMGYEVVEFWAPYYQWTPAQAKDVRKLLDDLGIKCNSTHNSGEAVTPEGLNKAIELNQIIGSKNIIQASEPPQARTIDDWKALAAKLTSFSEQLKPLGMATGYHNHAREWPLLQGQRPMDVIAAMQTTMIRATMTAYSTAVGPSSYLRNSTNFLVMTYTCILQWMVLSPLWPSEGHATSMERPPGKFAKTGRRIGRAPSVSTRKFRWQRRVPKSPGIQLASQFQSARLAE